MARDLKQALIDLLDDVFGNKMALVCKVVSNDGVKCRVKDVRTESTYRDIRLQANPGNGILLIPKTGSFVIIQLISDTAGYVALYSALDSIQLLDGSFGGLIKIDELVTKLNTLEQRMTSHQHISALSGSPTTVDVITNPDITETVKADIENTDVTHGSK